VAKLSLGVLISGRGSNLQALIAACASPGYPARVVQVISDQPDASGLAHAVRAGIAARTLVRGDFSSRSAFEAAIDATLRDAGVELVCLAGFMRVLSADFVAGWRDRLINVHPSLLPAFKGLDTHARVLAAGARFSGATVHFVRAEVDAGPILVQCTVPVADDDTAETLAARVLRGEHRCYPLAVRLIAEGRVAVAGERVHIAGATSPSDVVINPTED